MYTGISRETDAATRALLCYILCYNQEKVRQSCVRWNKVHAKHVEQCFVTFTVSRDTRVYVYSVYVLSRGRLIIVCVICAKTRIAYIGIKNKSLILCWYTTVLNTNLLISAYIYVYVCITDYVYAQGVRSFMYSAPLLDTFR